MGAKLSTTLSLVDGFSSKLNSVNNSLQKTSSSMDKFRNMMNKPMGSGLFSSLTGGIKTADSAMSSFSASAAAKIGAISGVVQSLTTTGINVLSNGIREMVGELSSASATWQTFEGNMAIMGKGASEIKAVKAELQDFATKTIYSASDMSSTYSQLAAVGTKNTTQLVEGFGGLAAAAEDPAQAMKTLSQQATQMAALPKVQWMDFKLMLQQTPAGMAAVAKQMGKSTEQLVKDIQDGKVATQDFFDAISKVGGDTNGDFYKMATKFKTIGQAMDGLKEGLTNKLQPAFDKASKFGINAISKIADKVDKFNFKGLEKTIDQVGPKIEKGLVRSFDLAVAGAKKLKQGFDIAKGAVQGLWSGFKGTDAISKAEGLFNRLKSSAKGVASSLKDSINMDGIGAGIGSALSAVMSAINSFIDGLGSTNALQSIKNAFESLSGALGNIKNNMPNDTTFFEKLGQLAGKGIERVADSISAIADAVGNLSPEQLSSAGNALLTLGTGLAALKGLGMISGVISTIASVGSTIIGVVSGIVSFISGAIGAITGIFSSVAVGIDGIMIGIGSSVLLISWPILAIIALVGVLAYAFYTNFAGIRDFTASAFGAIADALGAAFSSLWNALQALGQALSPLIPVLQVLGMVIVGIVVAAFIVLIAAIGLVVDAFVGIIDVISTVIQVVAGVGNVFKKLFSGDIKGAADEAGKAIGNIKDIWSGFANNAVTPKLNDSLNDIVNNGAGAKDSLDGVNSSASTLSGTLGGIKSPKIEPQFTMPDTSKLGMMNLPDIPVGAKVDKVDTAAVSQSPLLPDLSLKAKVNQVDASPLTSGGVPGLNSLLNNPLPVPAKVDKVDTSAVSQTNAVPDINVGAKVNQVDTSAVATAGAGIQPLTMPAKVGQIDTSSLAVGSPALAALQSNPAVIPTKTGTPDTSAATAAIANIGTSAPPIQTPPVTAPDTSAATSALTNLQTTAQNTVQPISNAGTQAGQGFVSGFQSSIGQAVGVAQNMGSQITGALSGVAGQMYGIGLNIGQGLANGMNASLGAVTAAASALAAQADKAARAKAEVHSPSRVFMATGQFFGQGLAIGMQKQYDNVANAGAGLFDVAYNGNNDVPSQPLETSPVSTTNSTSKSETTFNFGDVIIQSSGDAKVDAEELLGEFEYLLQQKYNANLAN
ncbi:tape measure protein [Lactococcus sp. LG1074]|uniref:tape measure protein n=1 Tax=Lactococcus TaxID=1357 RepID=UPI001A8D09BC|nr:MULTISPECIES: tape measure protein [Lactococcus]QSR02703.1 tape measure protein [Lactococcus sp. LG1074]